MLFLFQDFLASIREHSKKLGAIAMKQVKNELFRARDNIFLWNMRVRVPPGFQIANFHPHIFPAV